jgi:hypothetical protein
MEERWKDQKKDGQNNRQTNTDMHTETADDRLSERQKDEKTDGQDNRQTNKHT